jgi:hypothetical protein
LPEENPDKEFVDKPAEVFFGNYFMGAINQDTRFVEPNSNIM